MTDQHKMPNFFLVGAPKAATSSLYHYLGQHPDIFVPESKEPHFFSWPEVGETYYDRDFVTTEAAYRGLYDARSGERFAGDFSPSYLTFAAAADRIKAFAPDARIMMVLRDPVKRAVSHYLMDRRLGCTKRRLADILDDPDKYPLFHREYVEIGRYHDNVAHYFELFSRDRVHVVIYEEFQSNPTQATREIFEFLGADANFEPDFSEVHNTFRMPRSQTVEKMRKTPLWSVGRALVPTILKDRIKPLMSSTKKPEFAAEERRLAELFADDNKRLESLLGRSLSHWM